MTFDDDCLILLLLFPFNSDRLSPRYSQRRKKTRAVSETALNEMNQKVTEGVKNLAIERLSKDLRGCLLRPLLNVVALPEEQNIFVWHVNCKGVKGSKFQDCLFHLQ